MLNISVDMSAFEHRLERTAKRIEEFGAVSVPEGLSAWQRDDMRRHYPNQETPDNKSAQTHIWPRSRLSDVYRHRHAPRAATSKRGRPKGVRTGQGIKKAAAKPLVRGTHRPILRPELMQKLCERMAALMQSKITWA